MNQDERKLLFIKVFSKFGRSGQFDMATEECAELIQAINKQRRVGGFSKPRKEDDLKYCKTYWNLCSEVADVKIMIEQLELLLSPEAIQMSYERKLERLKKRVEA